MPSTSSSPVHPVRAEILAYSRAQSAVHHCWSQELTTSSDINPANEAFQRTRSVSELCSLFEQASLVCVGDSKTVKYVDSCLMSKVYCASGSQTRRSAHVI